MEPAIAFGEVIKRHRNSLGITKAELARNCGLDKSYIGLLESEKRQPTIATIFKIAEGLNMKPNVLIEEVEKHIKDNNG